MKTKQGTVYRYNKHLPKNKKRKRRGPRIQAFWRSSNAKKSESTTYQSPKPRTPVTTATGAQRPLPSLLPPCTFDQSQQRPTHPTRRKNASFKSTPKFLTPSKPIQHHQKPQNQPKPKSLKTSPKTLKTTSKPLQNLSKTSPPSSSALLQPSRHDVASPTSSRRRAPSWVLEASGSSPPCDPHPAWRELSARAVTLPSFFPFGFFFLEKNWSVTVQVGSKHDLLVGNHLVNIRWLVCSRTHCCLLVLWLLWLLDRMQEIMNLMRH